MGYCGLHVSQTPERQTAEIQTPERQTAEIQTAEKTNSGMWSNKQHKTKSNYIFTIVL